MFEMLCVYTKHRATGFSNYHSATDCNLILDKKYTLTISYPEQVINNFN